MLLLWKGVYPYEYKDDWEKFNETLPPEKENFYNNLNMENITDGDYTQFVNVLKQKIISWFVCSKQYIIVSRCISEL